MKKSSAAVKSGTFFSASDESFNVHSEGYKLRKFAASSQSVNSAGPLQRLQLL
jgi:hypothetical protein